jgi:hypothetical protein
MSVIADLSAVEVADALGLDALQRELVMFRSAGVVAPPSWVPVSRMVRARLGQLRVVERLRDLFGDEQRQYERSSMRLPAKLYLVDHRAARLVTKDVSRGGARLVLAQPGRLVPLASKTVRVDIPQLHVRNVAARVVHENAAAQELGVAFLSPLPARRLSR